MSNVCLSCHLSWRPLQWRHNGRDGVSNHQPHHCLLNCLFRSRSKKTSKLRVTGLCAGNSPVTGEFPAQMASNTENVSIWWRHHGRWWYVRMMGHLVMVLVLFAILAFHLWLMMNRFYHVYEADLYDHNKTNCTTFKKYFQWYLNKESIFAGRL